MRDILNYDFLIQIILKGYKMIGAVHEARTRDLDLGKVALYQLS